MKAWVQHDTGDPGVLQLEDRPIPRPGPGEVLVRNRAIGLNPVDWKFIRWGHEGWDWPHIPGVDGAGEVVALGSLVSRLCPGTPVAYHNDLLRPGSFAEYTLIPARAAIPLPAALPFPAAAAIPCPGLTARQAIEKLPLKPGAHVLLTGASGAVGGALMQLARERGWIIHAVGSASQAERLLRLGAATVTDYRRPDWCERWAARVQQHPLQAVIDMVSGAHAASLASLIAANGHLVCIQDRQESAPLAAFTTTISLHEVGLNALHHHGSDRQWAELVAAGSDIARRMLDGSFDPQLIEVAGFDQLPAALERLKSGPNPGNRVVTL
ncbi:zinc-binding dehydrogenase [Paracoccus kondratievae]|uniref:alcohol dehydrogenase catalytic domain-containing protein n=1 Tax=Paracoccus kondratievae TaxID=135740 RepID=UPI00126610A2|nr:zinc-binding dehydrogenase [Paracoccus kondratievae]QFQ86693.1 zinc-binding dehydrogenase [Paracoccus kondratievae]